MSWTIEKTEQNANDVDEIEKAIQEAAKEGILMFCAAADDGPEGKKTFPAASNEKKIFRIGAANENGNVWECVGKQEIDYIFPGQNIVQERYKETPLKACETLTGSSVATAIAAGLAALVLECVQLAAIFHHSDIFRGSLNEKAESSRSDINFQGNGQDAFHFESLKRAAYLVSIQDYKDLKRYDRMKMAFENIGVTNQRYIEVWKVFKITHEQARGMSLHEKLETVAGIARQLIADREH